MLNRVLVLEKTGFIKEQVNELRRLMEEKSKNEIATNPWVLRGVKYALQTAIEAGIDLAYHVCAKEFDVAPQDARDAFKKLSEKGIIPETELKNYSSMVGFRNRLVHGYMELSSDRIYEILVNNLDDLDSLRKRFLDLIG